MLLAAVLLCLLPFGRADEAALGQAQQIIDAINNYMDDYLLTSISLPNIGILSLDPVRLRNGTLGQLDTMRLNNISSHVWKVANSDNSTTYTFDLRLGLDLLVARYNYIVKLLNLLEFRGDVSISPQVNEAQLQGLVVLMPDGRCDARLDTLTITKYDNFFIFVEPDRFPWATQLAQTILNFVSPKLLPVTNIALQSAVFVPPFQDWFSSFVCKHVS